MAFYDLTKEERKEVIEQIFIKLLNDFKYGKTKNLLEHFSDEDTYVRKNAYQVIGKIYKQNPDLQKKILEKLTNLLNNENEKIRQTTINAVGEIGKSEFEKVICFFDKGLFDEHHSVKNAVIGSLKKMVEKNPKPVLKWVEKYIEHENAEIRREVCHGIELRGRTHPQDILPLLKKLQFEQKARVKNTLIHVLGQISYKKGCLETVIKELNNWENKKLVEKAVLEIIDVHKRYEKFTYLAQVQAIEYIEKNLKDE